MDPAFRVELNPLQSELIQFVWLLPWLQHAVFVGTFVPYLSTRGSWEIVNHNKEEHNVHLFDGTQTIKFTNWTFQRRKVQVCSFYTNEIAVMIKVRFENDK